MINSRNLVLIIGIAISAISLAIVLKKVDLELFLSALKEVRIFPLFLMIILYLFGFLLRGLRWRLMLNPFKKINWRRTSALVIIGYMGNNILPARLGELLRVYVTGKKEGISKMTVLGSIAIERIFDGLVLISIFSTTIMFADFSPEYAGVIKKVGLMGWIIFGLALVFVLTARLRGAWICQTVNKIIGYLPQKFAKIQINHWIANLINSTSFLKIDRALPIVIFLSVAVWFTEGLVFLTALKALNLPLSFVLAFFALSFTSLGLAIPSAPAYVGLFQGLVLMVFTIFGLETNAALAYSVVSHVVMILPITILGLVFLNMYGESILCFNKRIPYPSADKY